MNKVLFYFWFLICLFFCYPLPQWILQCVYLSGKNPLVLSSSVQDLSPVTMNGYLVLYSFLPERFFIGHSLLQDTALQRCVVTFSGTAFTLCSYNKCTELVYKDLQVRLRSRNYVFLKIKRQGIMSKESKISVFSFKDWEESISPFSTHEGT